MTPAEPGRTEGIRLGRVLGVPVSLAWSWFLIAAFMVVVFGPQVARAIPGIGVAAYVVAFAYAVLLMLSVLIHELAHAVSAKAFGWPGARIVLTLWGGHTQFGSFHATPGKSLLVALAGPVANFLLAGLGHAFSVAAEPSGVVGLLTTTLVWANFLVALFNVLPGLPLDGGRLVESLVWRATGSQEHGTVAAGWAGRVIVVALIAYFVGWPLAQGRALDLQFTLVAVLVAGFLWTGAGQAIRDARMRQRLPDVSVRGLMEPAKGLAADATVADIDALLRRHPGHVVLMADDGTPEAVVDSASLASVPPELRATTRAGTVARALADGAVVAEDGSGRELIAFLASLSGSEYAVIDSDGEVTGLLVQSAVVGAITGRGR
ncbi:site-2 protease family protein [Arthrobacter sp. KK5.5]|uniref:site-2 protease family protein n=1 Tax=Arthrobacter sp. KK5.5 TaxID=3373084 RepID=UPI003EE609AE